MEKAKTTITISVPTRKRIHDLQEYGETIEDIIVRLLDYYKEGQVMPKEAE